MAFAEVFERVTSTDTCVKKPNRKKGKFINSVGELHEDFENKRKAIQGGKFHERETLSSGAKKTRKFLTRIRKNGSCDTEACPNSRPRIKQRGLGLTVERGSLGVGEEGICVLGSGRVGVEREKIRGAWKYPSRRGGELHRLEGSGRFSGLGCRGAGGGTSENSEAVEWGRNGKGEDLAEEKGLRGKVTERGGRRV